MKASNAPILLLCFGNSDQKLRFECESITFYVNKNKFKSVILLKTDTIDYLFIPFETIGQLLYSGLKVVPSAHNLNKQFADLDFFQQDQTNGFIVPIKFINKLILHLDDETIKLFESNEEVLNKIFKANLIECRISNFDRLLEIVKLLPDDFSRINFEYNNWMSKSITDESCLDIPKSFDNIEIKFCKIIGNGILQYNELNLICKILRSRRTRFNISSINITLKFLSKCKVVLSLCEDCPELFFCLTLLQRSRRR